VISGAACSGKTTLIDQLVDKGFQTIPESGRQYFERELAKGRTVAEIRESEADERGMKDLQLSIECGLRANEVIFLDRAFPDCLAYFRISGLDPNEILEECFHHRYASVFIFDRLPFKKNGVRREEEAAANFLDEWITRDYSALGYSVVRVPILPPPERLAFVLEWISETGLK
jgi:predicted ATPase